MAPAPDSNKMVPKTAVEDIDNPVTTKNQITDLQISDNEKKEKVDELWAEIGSYGRWQKRILIMSFFISFFNAVPEMQYIFISAEPDHWCKVEELQNTNWTKEEIKSVSIPKEIRHGEKAFSLCQQYNLNYTYLSELNYSSAYEEVRSTRNKRLKPCSLWEYDTSVYSSTTVTEWDLVCSRKALSSVALSAFMIGVLVSCLCSGVLADKYGRRPVLLWGSMLWIITGAIQCFPPTYSVYVISSFFVALFVHAAYAAGFVIITEIVGTATDRSLAGILFQTPYLFGFMAVPGLAYLIRDWRYLQWAFTFPVAIILCTVWFIPESPRWLINVGRTEEAKVILLKAAKENKKKLTETDVDRIIQNFIIKNFIKTKTPEEKSEATCKDQIFSVVTLFSKLVNSREMLRRTVLSYFCWFAMNIMFFGLSFDAIHLPVDPFLATFIIATVDLPAVLFSIPIIDRYGRRLPTSVLFFIGGIACLLEIVPPADMGWLVTTFSSIGKLCATACYVIMYLYQAELYPTEIRNLGVGAASVVGRTGSVVAPYIVSFSLLYNKNIPKVVFGVSGLIAGGAALFLPETNNKEIPETVAEIQTNTKYKIEETKL